jgi:hypothetical protein
MEYFEIIIKWDKIPKGYDFVAIDEDGRMYAYPQIPKRSYSEWVGDGCIYLCELGWPTDFTQCLYERPQTQTEHE